MKSINSVACKAFIKQFYQENTGFFLLTLSFGFLRTPHHVDLAGLLAFSPLYYLVPYVLWIGYTIKVLSFFKRKRKQADYSWVNFLLLMGEISVWKLSFSLSISLLAPIVGYTLFLLAIAIHFEQWLSTLAVFMGLIGIIFALHTVKRQIVGVFEKQSGSSFYHIKWMPKSIPFHFVEWLLTKRGPMLLFTKVISIAILIVGILIFQVEGIDPM